MKERRPNPDTLLRRTQAEERGEKRGKLKIYLGAAPGVGKTYEMLSDGLKEKAKGIDIIVGIAESHGRQEIEAMLKNLDVLARLKVDYHGKELSEFDLEGALKRQPKLILIDEMAHTNAPGLRHKKRWQDIKELLDRGIDVYTTLNVQHIESLNDHVSQIIHAPVKETIPDSMIEHAETIELVDIPPEELLERLHEGKVYLPEQAKLASELFFRKGNLIALRELALRTAAETVNAQVLLYRQGQGIQHVWPTKERILVCVGPGPESNKLIRGAKRLASSLQVEWIAVYVETPKMSPEEHKKALQNLQLANQLGAETRVLSGFNISKEILNFAHEQNVTQIMVWKHIHTRILSLFSSGLADEIMRQSGEIDVYIMTGERQEQPIKKTTFQVKDWKIYSIAIFIVTFATLINLALFPWIATTNLIMIYLLAVTMIALFGRNGPAIVGSILSIFAYVYFFIPPYYHIIVSNLDSFFTLLVMLLISLVISQLTIVTRHQAMAARTTASQTSALYSLTRRLSSTRGRDKLLRTAITYMAEIFDCDISALMPSDGNLEILAQSRPQPDIDKKELNIANWVYELGQKAGMGTDSLSFSDALYIPLLASQNVLGVLRIRPAKKENLLLPERMQLIEACSNQLALALEVDRLHEQTKKSELRVETDRMKSALLQSFSHDLNKPLVAIMGNASTQIELANEFGPREVERLGKSIYLEAEQASRLINNLLQMTYLETKQVKLQKQLLSLSDIINLVIKTSSKKLLNRKVNVHVSADLPLVPIDNILLQEVLINLIDNAVKFTPVGSPIEISAQKEKNNIIISVEDCGPGIVHDEINKLFEKFYRGRMLTSEYGSGLGLAICRMIIAAHGGKIWAENRKESGAAFRFTLPI